MAVVAIFVATIVSCAMLPHPAIPEANGPEAHPSSNGAENELTLTFGSYDWSYTANGQRYARQLVQVGSQRLDASELAQLDLAGSTPVTVRFDVTPITAYVRDWEEVEPREESTLGSLLFRRVRPVLDTADSLGDEVPSTYENGQLAFEVEPGRRWRARGTVTFARRPMRAKVSVPLARPLARYRLSSSESQRAEQASEGMRRSPRGLTAAEPTLGPSGRQLRLNCWAK